MKTKYHSALSAAEPKSRDRILSSACAIRGRWWAVALSGFMFTSIFALSPSPVDAQCNQWNVGHYWLFDQGAGNSPTKVVLDLHQNGSVITGTAVHQVSTGRVSGTVDGTLEGDQFAVHIYWDNNTVGVYDGTIRPSGRIEGKGYEQATPRIKVNWHSETSMVCADAPAVEPTNPTPKPIRHSGAAKTTPTPKPIRQSGKAKTSTASPTISVNPVAVTIPDGQSHGTTTLTWDGGPDHPDAEVWMKVGWGGEETLVVQQGKGTLTLTVQGGKSYQLFLKDAGQQLARAVVLTRQ